MEKKIKKNLSFFSDDFFKSSEKINLDIKNLNYTFVKHCLGINNFIYTSNNIINKHFAQTSRLDNLNKKSLQNTNLIQDNWIIIDEK